MLKFSRSDVSQCHFVSVDCGRKFRCDCRMNIALAQADRIYIYFHLECRLKIRESFDNCLVLIGEVWTG